jgi:hypothetical protein
VELLVYWCSEGRQLFTTADRFPALWPSERCNTIPFIALAEQVYAGYADYRVTTTNIGRQIPIIRLTPL